MSEKLPEHHQQWFDTLCRAAKNGDLALMLCTDAATGEDRSVISVTQRNEDGSAYFIPLGHLATTENPFDAYNPPETEPRKTH